LRTELRTDRVFSLQAAQDELDAWVEDGVMCVHWQQVALVQAAAGKDVDVWVTDQVLQFWDGDTVLRTQARKTPGEPIRKKRASVPRGRSTLKKSVTTQPE
jgi:hypothetical protein